MDPINENFSNEENKNQNSNNNAKSNTSAINSKDVKSLFSDLLKKPFAKINELANDTTASKFSYAVVLIVIWCSLLLLSSGGSGAFKYLDTGNVIWLICRTILEPVLTVTLLTAIIMFIGKENTTSFKRIFTTITTAYIPVVFARVILLLNLIPGEIYKITSPIHTVCSFTTVVLIYFGIKSLLKKDDDEAIKKFVLVEAIYEIIALILGLMQIYI